MNEQDMGVRKLYELSNSLTSLQSIKNRISSLEKKKKEVSGQIKPFTEKKLSESDFYNKTRYVIEREERRRDKEIDVICKKKKNTAYFFFIVAGIFFCALFGILYTKYGFTFINGWLKERWWVLFFKKTPERVERMFYLSMIAPAILFGFLINDFWLDYEDEVAGKIIKVLSYIFAGYCLIRYFISSGLLGLILWIPFLFCGLFHIIIVGTLNFLSYALVLLILFLPYFFYMWARSYTDRYSQSNYRAKKRNKIFGDISAIKNSQEYKNALEIDQKEAPQKYQEYMKQYNIQKDKHETLCNELREEIRGYEKLIAECLKIKAQIELEIKNNDVLHADDKNSATINELIFFIAHKRANTIKEALNCLAQERHNRRVEAEIQKQREAIKETLIKTKAVQDNLRAYQTQTQKAFGELEKRIAESEEAMSASVRAAAAQLEKAEREMSEKMRDTVNSRLASIESDQVIQNNQIVNAIRNL